MGKQKHDRWFLLDRADLGPGRSYEDEATIGRIETAVEAARERLSSGWRRFQAALVPHPGLGRSRTARDDVRKTQTVDEAELGVTGGDKTQKSSLSNDGNSEGGKGKGVTGKGVTGKKGSSCVQSAMQSREDAEENEDNEDGGH